MLVGNAVARLKAVSDDDDDDDDDEDDDVDEDGGAISAVVDVVVVALLTIVCCIQVPHPLSIRAQVETTEATANATCHSRYVRRWLFSLRACDAPA